MSQHQEDDDLKLDPSTLALLHQVLQEKEAAANSSSIDENWGLSQFWYTEETSARLASACIEALATNGTIACLCAPSMYQAIIKIRPDVRVLLFEYDRRFSCYGDSFVFYDFNDPLSLPIDLKGSCDVVAIDPPFLNRFCLEQVSETVRWLFPENQPKKKLLIATGLVQEPVIEHLFTTENGYSVIPRRTNFVPEHRSKLANQFACWTTFPTKEFEWISTPSESKTSHQTNMTEKR